MTIFLDLRAIPSGGIVAKTVTVLGTDAQLPDAAVKEFEDWVRGRNIVLATHGFNVDSADGQAELTQWGALCGLTSPWDFIGVLWPGDSRYLPFVDYPVEGSTALNSGRLLAAFLNAHAAGAASVSLVSHSLGARTMLEAVAGLKRRVATLILMAGAIEDDCLTNEYAQAMTNVDNVQVVASRSDWVLAAAFPIGNPVGELVMHGHPYFREALGRAGPHTVAGLQARYQLWQIPDAWNYGHLDYLPGSVQGARMPPPLNAPGRQDPTPSGDGDWKPSWSAGVISTETSGS